jgi:hypothetical protein
MNERLRSKRTEYHFALLGSTAPSEAVFDGRSKLRGISPLSGLNHGISMGFRKLMLLLFHMVHTLAQHLT